MNAEPEPTIEGEPRGESDSTPRVDVELEKLRGERDRAVAQAQRAQADYQNLRKRTSTEIDLAVKRTLSPLLDQVFLALDGLELALSSRANADELAVGVRLTRDTLVRGLELAGVQKIAAGPAFDPQRHEAVDQIARDDLDPGTVVEVLREGYTFQSQVLRPAQVRVSTSAQPKQEH